MAPGTIMDLTKSITVKGGGLIATYKLCKGATVRVLVLDNKDSPTEAEQLATIDAAAETAKQNIRHTYTTKG